MAEKRKSQTREGAGVCWEAGGGRASSRTAGPSFPDGACETGMRLSPTAVPRRQQHIAAGDSARPKESGRSGWEAALVSERVNTEMGGGGDRAAGRGMRDWCFEEALRPPGCRPAGPAAPPSASSSQPGRAEYLEG